ncbi:hypothetical protein [Ideonella sp.]|uniref:hypothetical protein n=1 Tax=Ideonella sp. TaxID=1929293 RepID=UPI002B466328|nr:hypothetical protein [Ideonella sp.]HJV68607.1 hypothetical protein [Ideonella sp.]
MARVLAFIVGAVAGWAAMTADAELPAAPESVACRQALDALQAQETAALSAARSAPPSASAPGAAASALQPWRERAARACLGGSRGSAAPARTAQPPVTVSPVTAGRPLTAPVAPPVPAQPALPARSEPLLTVVGCDPAGCWASDGSRLNRVGPNLVGPRGACTLEGAVLRCP